MSAKVKQSSRTMSGIVEQSHAKSNKLEKCPVKLNKEKNEHHLIQNLEKRHRSTHKVKSGHHLTASIES